MTAKKILVLAIILAGVLGYIFFYEVPKGKEKEIADQAFKGLKEEQLKSIEIKKGERKVLLQNKDYKPDETPAKNEKDEKLSEEKSEWELAAYPGAPIENSMVQGLISPVLSLKLDGAIPKEEQEGDLGVYGLANPEIVVGVNHAKGEAELRLGKKNDYVLKRYFQLKGDDRVYMGPDNIYLAADKNEKDFRKKKVLSFTDFEVKRLNVSKSGRKLLFEKGPEEKWRVIEPIEATGAKEKISELFRELRDYSAEEFIDFKPDAVEAALKEHRLDAPDLVVTIEKSEGEPLSVIASEIPDLEDPTKSVTVFRAGKYPFIGRMKKSVIERISMNASDYRERKLFSYGAALVKKIEIEHAGQAPLVLELDKDAWKLGGKEADQAFVQQFLKNASELSAAAFPEVAVSANYGFDKPALKITLWTAKYGSDEKPQPTTLLVGAETENGYFAATGDLKEPFIITKEALKGISPAAEALLPVEVTPTAAVAAGASPGAGS